MNNNKNTADGEIKKEKTAPEKQVIADLQKKVLELEKKAAERDEYLNKYARAQADYDNARKRMERDMQQWRMMANESIMNDLFPVLDSFDGAMQTLEKEEKNASLLDGLKLIQDKFHKVLEANGLAVIKTVGEKFDPLIHEAVMKVASDKYADGIVTEEIRKGYALNGSVLRPAMVKVAVNEALPRKMSEDKAREKSKEDSIG